MKKLLTGTALLAVLAFSGVAYAQGWHHEGGPGPHRPAFMEVLPKDKAAQFEDTMKQARAKNMVLIDQKHKLKDELHAILTAPKFDKDAYIAKSEEMSKFRETMHEKMRANMREAFATAVSALSQEDREALAGAMEKEHAEHRMHGGHGGGWHGPMGDKPPMPPHPMDKPHGDKHPAKPDDSPDQ